MLSGKTSFNLICENIGTIHTCFQLLLLNLALLIGSFPIKYCSSFKNPFYGLTLHGSIGLGVKPIPLLSEPKTSASTSSSSIYPHYHYPFGPYHASKAKYPSPSINQDGRYSHFLQLSRSRSDDLPRNNLGYHPVKHYEKSNYENGLDFLIHLLSGDSSKVHQGHQGHRPKANLSSPTWQKFSHSQPFGHLDSYGSYSNEDRREYHHPFRPSPVDHQTTKLVNPFVSYSPSLENPDNHFPSIYQHPLLQIVPLLVIEKRQRIRPRPPNTNWGNGPSPPYPQHLPPPFDHPLHYQPPHHPQFNFRNSKINFPVDEAPPQIQLTTSKFQPFPTSFGNENQFQHGLAKIPPHIRQFVVQDPFAQNGAGSMRFKGQKNIFPVSDNYESNNFGTLSNFDGADYPDIITANNVASQMKFPVEPSPEIGNEALFSHPSLRNSHQYSPTTGPDFSVLSPLLLGSESKQITDKMANSTLPIKGNEDKTKIERRTDGYMESTDNVAGSKNYDVWMNKLVKVPDFIPMPTNANLTF